MRFFSILLVEKKANIDKNKRQKKNKDLVTLATFLFIIIVIKGVTQIAL